MITIPPVPEGIFDPNDLCNQVYNEDPELVNLKWSSPRFQDSLEWILESSGGKVEQWASTVNVGSPEAAPMRTSTMVRISVAGTYDDFDVRNVYRTPSSVVTMLYELANKGAYPPQFKPYIYEARNPVSVDPVGAEWPDHIFALNGGKVTGRKIYHSAGADNFKIGDTFERRDGIYQKLSYWVKTPSLMGNDGVQASIWERVYAR